MVSHPCHDETVTRMGHPSGSQVSELAVSMRMMNEFEAQVLSDLSVLKTQMAGLVGDGNTGRIYELERRVERHELNLQRAKGFMAATSLVMAVIQVAMEALRRH